MRLFSLRKAVALCAASGVLLSLCFPPAGLWPVAWVALVPWLVALRLGGRAGALLGSWVGGFVFFGLMLYWLSRFGVSVWVLTALILAVATLVWGIYVWQMRGSSALARTAGAALVWCGIEWARGLGPYGFTWGWLGYSQSPALAVLPVARVAGAIGISFLIVLVNAVLAEVTVALVCRWRVRRSLAGALTACAFVALIVFVAGRSVRSGGDATGPSISVAVAQGSAHGELRPEDVNVPLTPEDVQRTMDIYGGLTEEAASERPFLVIWPESVLPGAPDEDPAVAEWLGHSAQTAGAWLVAGGPYYDEERRLHNAAYLFAPSGHQVARYDKVHLVPFGEYVPARSWLPFLNRYNVRDVDFAAGGVHRLLQTDAVTLGPMICFESIFPQISWEIAQRGAQVLVIITNDAWFGRTAAAEQHRQIAVLRAVETDRWVLRAASAGISSIIRPDGRIVAEAGLFEREVLSADIRVSPYGRETGMPGSLVSWLFLYASIAHVAALALSPRFRRRPPATRQSSSPPPPDPEAPR
jgi:apolipoprotein N-acyltransferase